MLRFHGFTVSKDNAVLLFGKRLNMRQATRDVLIAMIKAKGEVVSPAKLFSSVSRHTSTVKAKHAMLSAEARKKDMQNHARVHATDARKKIATHLRSLGYDPSAANVEVIESVYGQGYRLNAANLDRLLALKP